MKYLHAKHIILEMIYLISNNNMYNAKITLLNVTQQRYQITVITIC